MLWGEKGTLQVRGRGEKVKKTEDEPYRRGGRKESRDDRIGGRVSVGRRSLFG